MEDISEYGHAFKLCDGVSLMYYPKLKRNRWNLLIIRGDEEKPCIIPLNEKKVRQIISNTKNALDAADKWQNYRRRIDALGEVGAQDLNEMLNP